MTQLRIKEVATDLEDKGVDQKTIEIVKQTIAERMKPETIDKAVVFLGLATILLVVGSTVLVALSKNVPEGLWGPLGAGMGGLAGIFIGKG